MKFSLEQISHHNYQPGIDGLRAIAVLSVVIFHAFSNLLPGGFIGVDIFFVISGYLISTIITNDLIKGNFSFVSFYKRRIVRIFPALIIVLISSYLVGWFYLYPEEFKALAKQIEGAVTFTNNYKFLKESGYFDIASELKPLLHLWSLSIEEQFYIFWPFLLFIVYKNKFNLFVFSFLIGIIAFSLHLNILQDNASAAFYKTPLRSWELMAGSLIAFIKLSPFSGVRNKGLFIQAISYSSDKFKKTLATLGLVLIIYGLFFITRNDTFPGWGALGFPVLGTMLILLTQNTLIHKFLSFKYLTWIGIISYPLYLWHWPIFSFTRIISAGSASVAIKILLILLSLILAFFTYIFIEKPVRTSKSKNTFAIVLIVILLILGVAAHFTKKMNGLADRNITTKENSLHLDYTDFKGGLGDLNYPECQNNFLTKTIGIGYCLVNKTGYANAAIIGDSHAADKFYGIEKNDSLNKWMLLAHPSCPPVYGINVEKDEKNCQTRSEGYIDWLINNKEIHLVALSYFGNYFLTTSYVANPKNDQIRPKHIAISTADETEVSRFNVFYAGLNNAIKKLIHANKKVVLIIDIPELPFMPIDCFRNPKEEICKISKIEVLKRQSELRRMIAQLKEANVSIEVFDPINFLCDDEFCSFYKDESILYRDSDHLTLKGSDLIGKAFYKELINKIN